jgi:hypothetical protein
MSRPTRSYRGRVDSGRRASTPLMVRGPSRSMKYVRNTIVITPTTAVTTLRTTSSTGPPSPRMPPTPCLRSPRVRSTVWYCPGATERTFSRVRPSMKSGTASPKSVTCVTSGGMTRTDSRDHEQCSHEDDAAAHGRASPRRSIASTAGLSAAASSIATMIQVRAARRDRRARARDRRAPLSRGREDRPRTYGYDAHPRGRHDRPFGARSDFLASGLTRS